MKTTKIWCLFSVANDYSQPENNLMRWWSEKPSIEKLASIMARPLDKAKDEDVVGIVNLWQGREYYDDNRTLYRLQEVEEDKFL